MPNGKIGDHPYTDIVIHNDDLGEPEIAAKVRALHRNGSERVQQLVMYLLGLAFPPFPQTLKLFYRQLLLENLTTIETLTRAEKA